jgi:predicted nucleic acid-binding protein
LKVGIDASVIVPLLAKRSANHQRAWAAYDSLTAAHAEFVVTDHALLESFSVLSRAPAPLGTGHNEAEELLKRNFSSTTIAPLAPGMAWDIIRLTLSRGFWGGRVYDAAIAYATFEAGARLLLTWNVKDFHSVAPVGLEVREP